MQRTEPEQIQNDLLAKVRKFKEGSLTSIPFVTFQIPFKKVEDDFFVYRGKDWQSFSKLKTFICFPGTAMFNHNIKNSDIVYPGLLSFLPPGHQIILPLIPDAPWHQYPTQIEYSSKSMTRLLEKKRQYLIDSQNIILGGYSSGSILALVIAVQFAKKGIKFRKLFFISPILESTGQVFKRQQLKKWEIYQRKDTFPLYILHFTHLLYFRPQADVKDPSAAPLRTPLEDLFLLKDNFIVYGEYDFYRRGIEVFRERLTQAGAGYTSYIVKDQGHRLLMATRPQEIQMTAQMMEIMRVKKTEHLRQVATFLKIAFL